MHWNLKLSSVKFWRNNFSDWFFVIGDILRHLSRPPCVPSFHQAFHLKKTQKASSELLTRSFCRKIGHFVNGEQKQNRAYWKNLNPMLENFCQIFLCIIKYTENCRSDYSLSSQLRTNGKFLFWQKFDIVFTVILPSTKWWIFLRKCISLAH